jgi:Zn-dependent peptidase ImmA (M78 family)
MDAGQAYAEAKAQALKIREAYGVSSPSLKLRKMRDIYKDQGIDLIYWPVKLKVVRGAYICDEDGPTVMVYKDLPTDPKMFTLAHELKHHLIDNGACRTVDNGKDVREIAAEVFAAELLLPETIFIQELGQRGVSLRQPAGLETVRQAIIKMKRETGTTLSYMGLSKRGERLGYAQRGELLGTKWKKLEEAYYGVPFYKRRPAYSF